MYGQGNLNLQGQAGTSGQPQGQQSNFNQAGTGQNNIAAQANSQIYASHHVDPDPLGPYMQGNTGVNANQTNYNPSNAYQSGTGQNGTGIAGTGQLYASHHVDTDPFEAQMQGGTTNQGGYNQPKPSQPTAGQNTYGNQGTSGGFTSNQPQTGPTTSQFQGANSNQTGYNQAQGNQANAGQNPYDSQSNGMSQNFNQGDQGRPGQNAQGNSIPYVSNQGQPGQGSSQMQGNTGQGTQNTGGVNGSNLGNTGPMNSQYQGTGSNARQANSQAQGQAISQYQGQTNSQFQGQAGSQFQGQAGAQGNLTGTNQMQSNFDKPNNTVQRVAPLDFPDLTFKTADNNYYEKIKSAFVKEFLLREGASLEPKSRKTPEEHAAERGREKVIQQLCLLQKTKNLEELSVDLKRKFSGNERIKKSGFCGTSIVTEYFDLYVDKDGSIAMEQVKGKKKESFKGRFKDIKVSDLDVLLKFQNTAEGKAKIGTKEEQKIVPPPGKQFKYVLAFSIADKSSNSEIGRNYFYLTDDKELEAFRNTVLTHSNLGEQFMTDFAIDGGAGHLKKITQLRKLNIAESLYINWCKQVEDELQRRNRKRPVPEMSAYLRRVAIKAHIKREFKSNLSDEEKKKKILMKLLKNMTSKTDEGRKQFALLTWRQTTQETRDTSASVVLLPKKYYNLYPETEDRNDLNSMNIDELNIVVSQTQHTQESIIGHDFVYTALIDILPIPSNSGLLATEFRVVSQMGPLDLSQFVGMFLVAYIRNKEDRKITAVGNYRISSKIPAFFVLEMKNNEKRNESTFEPITVGSVNFRREGLPISFTKNYMFDTIMEPENLGFMRRFYTSLLRDHGLTNIAEPQGVGRKYQYILNFLKEEYQVNSLISRYECDKYRWGEWMFFEDLLEAINSMVIKRGNDTLIVNSTGFKDVMTQVFKKNPCAVDTSSKGYLYHSRDQWRENSEYARHQEFQEKAWVTGMPDYLYLPVWKSLGKTSVIKQLVFDICSIKIPGFSSSRNLFDQLATAGADELSQNPNLEKDVVRMDTDYGFSSQELRIIRKVLGAFLKLSNLMEDVSNDVGLKAPVLKGFSLKVVGGLVHIVKHLVSLYNITSRGSTIDDRCKEVTEDDVFWVLLSIAFVFLPEHFFNPLLGFEPDKETTEYYRVLKSLGIDVGKYQRNQMFVSSGAIGSYKLSLILANCIQHESPELYNKMTDLGFPFLSFGLERSECLFSDFMNPDTLNKFWNIIFFEGADTIKRRAQQMILSALMVIIKECSQQIMNSHSAQEIQWYLSAHLMFNFEGTQFIADLLKVRKAYFINENPGVGLVTKINSIFSNITGGRSIEQEFQEIKSDITKDFSKVAVANEYYIKDLKKMTNSVESSGKPLDILHMKKFLESWNVRVNSVNNALTLHLDDDLYKLEYTLAEKPQIQHVAFSICTWDIGNYLPEKFKVTFLPNFKREIYSMVPGTSEWFKKYNLDGSLIQTPVQAWFNVILQGTDRSGKKFASQQQINLSQLKYNKTGYFYIQYNSFWMVVSLKITPNHIKTDDHDYFKLLDHDLQHRGGIFCEEFADHMEIKRQTPYKEELLNNTCSQKMIEVIFNYALKAKEQKLSKDFINEVVKCDLLEKGIPNLFELIVRFIMFMPMDNMTILRQMFTLLNRLDLTPAAQKVKRSHVEFLIWFILRVTLIYLPYSEVVSTVGTALNGSDSCIISAVISSISDTRKPSLNITDMLNLWFVAQRRRTAVSGFVIGRNGYLKELEKAITFWQAEHQHQQYKFSKINKLRVFINCKGDTRKVEFKFDDTMRIIFDNKDRDFEIETEHVLLLEDSDESLNFGQFTQIMTQFQVLDWIFTRLTGVASDNAYGEYIKNIQAQELKNLKSLEMTISYRLFETQQNKEVYTDLGFVHYIKNANSSLVDFRKDPLKLDFLLDNQELLTFGQLLPSKKDLPKLTNDITIQELIDYGLDVLAHEVVNSADPLLAQYKYSPVSLALLSASSEESRVYIQNTKLNPDHLEATLATASNLLGGPAKLSIVVDIPKASIKPVYNHLAKDIYYLEGVDVVNNPFMPCQILSKNSAFAEVTFKNDNGKLIFIQL